MNSILNFTKFFVNFGIRYLTVFMVENKLWLVGQSLPQKSVKTLPVQSRWSDPASGNSKLLLTFYNNGGNDILEKVKDPAAAGALRIGDNVMYPIL